MPENNFLSDQARHSENSPALLIAGGIGITAIKSIAQSFEAANIAFELHYGAKSEQRMAFSDRLKRQYGQKLHCYFSEQNQRIDLKELIANASPKTVFYICGPDRLINEFLTLSKRYAIDPQRVVYERFSHNINADAKPVTVTLAKRKHVIEVAKDQSILDALIDADIDLPFSCKSGECRSCMVNVLSGEAEHHDNALSDHERDELNMMCPCVSRAKTKELTLDL
jgi:ferredoxin-NADP reductase